MARLSSAPFRALLTAASALAGCGAQEPAAERAPPPVEPRGEAGEAASEVARDGRGPS